MTCRPDRVVTPAFQLSLALADLLLQMTSWTTPIQDLILNFGPINEQGTSHLRPLLKVLTVLPEELSSRTLRLDANRRSEVLQLFTASTEDVLQLLVSHNHSYYLSRF